MACESTCELVQFRVTHTQFLRIQPRPRAGAPADLEQSLLQLVRKELEADIDSCPEGCECIIGEPEAVASAERIKKVSDGTYTAWYRVTLTKYRTRGECMPKSDEPPAGT